MLISLKRVIFRLFLIGSLILVPQIGWAQAAQGQAVMFQDIQNHWAKDTIERLAKQQIIRGVTPQLFAPDKTVTYEEWYALLDRINKYQPISTAADPLMEAYVPTNHWAYHSVNRLYKIGVLYGFDRGNPILREEVAETAARFLGIDELRRKYYDQPVNRFKDIAKNENEQFIQPYTAILAANDFGIIKGFPDGTFRPAAPLTRAQAAVIIENIQNQHQAMIKAASNDQALKADITEALQSIKTVSEQAHGNQTYSELQKTLSGIASPAFLDTHVKWYHDMNLEGTDASVMIPSGKIAASGHGIYLVTPVVNQSEIYKVYIRENWGELHGFVQIECYVVRDKNQLKVISSQDVYQQTAN
ncbi:S-layer homology domain-containing protein [Brevibacillus sp. SYSU BS000544]|uniref:S-layer homology domain-containing protein n=1 Tax=Brevibacillus sp. SYSU BS000544 TaxID=3416443 RepID=UPI003CE54ED6